MNWFLSILDSAFRLEDMLDVEIILPDISFLKGHKEKIRGLAVTHLVRDAEVPLMFGQHLRLVFWMQSRCFAGVGTRL